MYRVVQSWGHMPADLFEDCVRALVYAGRVGCASTLDSYEYDVRCLVPEYHTCVRTVCAPHPPEPSSHGARCRMPARVAAMYAMHVEVVRG